jgi:hypothetical protein
MRLAVGVSWINASLGSSELRLRLFFPNYSKKAPVAVIRLVLARLAPNYIFDLHPIFCPSSSHTPNYTVFGCFWTPSDTVFHITDITAI